MKSRTKYFVLLLLLCVTKYSSAQYVIDESFAQQGKLRLHLDDYNEAIDILNAGNDSLFVLCNTSHVDTTSYNSDIVLAKILPDGNVDLSYGQNSALRFDFDGADISTAKSFLKHGDGAVYVLGNGFAFSNVSYNPFCIASIKANGTIDSAFGTNGTLKIVFAGGNEIPVAIKADSNNRILFCGSTVDTGDTHSEVPVIARMSANGIADAGFGNNGKVFLRIGGGILQSRGARHLIGGGVNDFIFLQGGKLLCAGGYSNGNNIASFFALLNNDGGVDTSFFDHGFLGIDFSPFASNYVSKLTEVNGKIIFAVRSDETVGRNFDYGILDLQNETFETDAIDFSGNEDVVKDMMLSSDGKVLFTGYSFLPQHNSLSYFSDYFSVGELTGSAYPYSNITQLFAFDANQQNGANAFEELTANKIMCAGFVNTVSGSDAALLKLQPTTSSTETISANKMKLVVYSNPINESLQFSVTGFHLNTKSVAQIFDVTGNLVWKEALPSSTLTITSSSWPSGIYLLRLIEDDGKTFQQKIVKQ